MKLSELIAKLQVLEQQGHGESTMAILVQKPHATIGPSAKAMITGVSPGFDWNVGVFIHVDETLYTGLEKLRKASRTLEDIHCWLNSRDEKMTDKEKINLVNKKIEYYHDKTKE